MNTKEMLIAGYYGNLYIYFKNKSDVLNARKLKAKGLIKVQYHGKDNIRYALTSKGNEMYLQKYRK